MEVNYSRIAKDSRLAVLDVIYKAQTSHIGSNFSCADILAVLFEKIDLEKEKFILSAGWKAAILYYHLYRKGRITKEDFESYCQEGSKFIGLAEPIHPDIPFAGGSMGYGLPASVGFSLSKKINKDSGNIYCLISDGELQCGTTWESALLASQHRLNNLVVFVDYNGYQAMGSTNLILNIEPLVSKFTSFGWRVIEIDGHSYDQIESVFNEDIKGSDKPIVVICHTIKGKGVSTMEQNNLYHYKNLSEEEYENAKFELNG